MKRRRLHSAICVLCILPLLYGLWLVNGPLPRSMEAAIRRMERSEMRSPGEILAVYEGLGSANVLIRRGDRLTLAYLHGEYRHDRNRYRTAITVGDTAQQRFLKSADSETRVENGKFRRQQHLIFPAPDENAVFARLTIAGTDNDSGESRAWYLTAERDPGGYYDFVVNASNMTEAGNRIFQVLGVISRLALEPYPYEAEGTLTLLDANGNELETQTFPMIYREELNEHGA